MIAENAEPQSQRRTMKDMADEFFIKSKLLSEQNEKLSDSCLALQEERIVERERVRCQGFSQVRVKTRRDRGDLEPKSKRGRRTTENQLRGPWITQGRGPTTQGTRIDDDTGKHKRTNINL